MIEKICVCDVCDRAGPIGHTGADCVVAARVQGWLIEEFEVLCPECLAGLTFETFAVQPAHTPS